MSDQLSDKGEGPPPSEMARAFALRIWMHCIDGQKNYDQEKAGYMIDEVLKMNTRPCSPDIAEKIPHDADYAMVGAICAMDDLLNDEESTLSAHRRKMITSEKGNLQSVRNKRAFTSPGKGVGE